MSDIREMTPARGTAAWRSWLVVAGVVLATVISGNALGAQTTDTALRADAVELQFPLGLAVGPDGSIYVSDRRANRVFRAFPDDGRAVVVAGTGERGFGGDGGPATAALLACPDSLDVDDQGNVYIADRCNERIRRVDATSGIIETVVGTGERGPAADGIGTSVALTGPFFLRASGGQILFTDTDAHRVRAYDPQRGRVTSLAGSGQEGFSGDGGAALDARLTRPHVALYTATGELVIGDSGNQRIRIVDTAGVIRTVAGNGVEGNALDGAAALESPFYFFGQILELPGGDLIFTEWWTGRLIVLERASGRIRVVAGSIDPSASQADGQAPLATRFGPQSGLAIDTRGRFLVAGAETGTVRRIDLEAGTVETVVGRPPQQ